MEGRPYLWAVIEIILPRYLKAQSNEQTICQNENTLVLKRYCTEAEYSEVVNEMVDNIETELYIYIVFDNLTIETIYSDGIVEVDETDDMTVAMV